MTTYRKQPLIQLFSESSRTKLFTCRKPLVKIVLHLACVGWNITVSSGKRNEEAQNYAFYRGWSKCHWPTSDHNTEPLSSAVDIAPYIEGIGIPWHEETPWIVLAGAFLTTAEELGYCVEWGGFYPGLKDLGHFSLKEQTE